MSDKLIPSNPESVMVIRNVTPNIVTLSLPFTRFGLIRIGGRGTIVKMTSGALAVFSPVALTPEVSAKLQSMGDDVKYMIAPDIEHHLFLSDWHAAYPKAHIIGPEGLPEKRQTSTDPKVTEVPFGTIFKAATKDTTKISEEFDRDFDYEYVDAHANKELVFCYKPEKTLIEADLMFNLPATEQYSRTGEPASKGFLTRLFTGFQGTAGAATGQKRFLWYALSSADRTGFAKSSEKIASWDFEKIIPCHGDVIEHNGKDIFRKVFEWHLEGKKST